MVVPRGLSRGRAENAGHRRVQRWLKDSLLLTYGSIWDGLDEEQIADRLEHMLIAPPQGRSLSQLLGGTDADVATKFRRGELAAPSTALRPPTHKGLTAGGLLSSMYSRIDPRLRPALLKELRAGQAGAPSFLLDAEVLLLKLLDGSLLPELDVWWGARAQGDADGVADVNEPPPPLPWGAAREWAYSCCGPVQGAVVASGEARDDLPEGTPCVYVPLLSAYLRMVVHGACSFYGVRAESVPLARLPTRWEGEHGRPAAPRTRTGRNTSGGGQEHLVLRLWLPVATTDAARAERDAIGAVRAQLAAASVFRPGGGEAPPPSSAESKEDGEEGGDGGAGAPLVPLLLVHGRSMAGGGGGTRAKQSATPRARVRGE